MSKFSKEFNLPESISIDDLDVKNTMLDLSLEHLAVMRIMADFYKDQFGIENFPSLVSYNKEEINAKLINEDNHDPSIILLLIESIAIQKTQARLIIETISSSLGISIGEATDRFYDDVDGQRNNLYAEIINRD